MSDHKDYYDNGQYSWVNDDEYFMYDGLAYEGWQTIEETVKAYKETLSWKNIYGKPVNSPCTNVVASEGFEQYIK